MIDLYSFHLEKGRHASLADGACLLELVSHLAGESFSDHPHCVSPRLAAFGRALNDVLDDEQRQGLLSLAPRLIGTADDGRDSARMWLARDWIVRTYTPAWLELAGLRGHATTLQALPVITSPTTLQAARAPLAAPLAAVRDAPLAAARDAARDAAWDAAWAAARDALAPTVATLQSSATELYERMVRG